MQVKPLLGFLKRISKSRNKEFLMINRTVHACYTIDIDADEGLNYVLFIPNNEDYSDKFYDATLIIEPDDIIKVYNLGHQELVAKKNEVKAKHKEILEEVYYHADKYTARLEFIHSVKDEVVATNTYEFTQYPVNIANPVVDRTMSTLQGLLNRIKVGGFSYRLDLMRTTLFDLAVNNSSVYYYKLKLGKQHIEVPFIKSLFMNINDFDSCDAIIQETEFDGMYVYTIVYNVNELTDCQYGYIINF